MFLLYRCPEYFNQEFLSKIKVGDVNSKSSQGTLDWRVKSSNLKKLVEYVNDFLDSVLETNHHRESVQVDAVRIARDSDVIELTKLLQLILASAVNCEKQENFVQIILHEMEVEDQLNVKKALEPFIPTSPSSLNPSQLRSSDANGHDPRSPGDGSSKSSKRFSARSCDDSMAQELFDLKREVSSLRDQNVALSDQNEDLVRKNLQLQQEIKAVSQDTDMMSTRSKVSVTSRKTSGKSDLLYDEEDEGELMSFKDQEIVKMKKKMEVLKEDLFRTSNQRDQLNQTIEYLKSQLNEESTKREEMARKLQEMKSLKDEVDILRSKNEQFKLNEVSVENYRKKIEELNEVIRGMKLQSSSNGSLRSSTSNLSQVNLGNNQKRKSASEDGDKEVIHNLKSQNEVLKKQVQETNSALAELTSVSMKKEMELMQAKDRLEMMDEQKAKYEQELRDQSNIIVNLKEELKSASRGRGSSYEPPDPLLYSIGHPQDPTEDLLTQLECSDGQKTELKKRLECSDGQKTELKKRVDDLKREVLLKESLIQDHISRIRDLEGENQRLKDSSEVMNDVKGSSYNPEDETDEQLAVARDQCQELREKLAELEQLLVKKEEEISELNERYKRCVSKAKQVARVLEVPLSPPGSSSSNSDVPSANNQSSPYHQLLPHQLMYQQSPVTAPSSFEIQMQQLMSLVTERDKTISELELEHEKMKAFKEVEERLMSVAFHSLVSVDCAFSPE